jgi:uncharacterized damage-inducible protein DinB
MRVSLAGNRQAYGNETFALIGFEKGPDRRMSRKLIESIAGEYLRYKALGEGAFAQMDDAALAKELGAGTNSIAIVVWHLSGNLKSRFTDFRNADGEKPWRNREEEFAQRDVSRQELLAKWEEGWTVLLAALAELTDDDLLATVTIRRQPLTIDQALLRSLAHASYHVGQIVHIAKVLRGAEWRSLSIPRGVSDTYNRDPGAESPTRHAASIKRRTT